MGQGHLSSRLRQSECHPPDWATAAATVRLTNGRGTPVLPSASSRLFFGPLWEYTHASCV
eukprot:198089-Pyramimonas_sp.AAC.1